MRKKVQQKAADRWASRFSELEKTYLSFFGLHFSQVLPAFVASWQHLWVHSLPAAFAFSQQVSARAMLTEPRKARAQASATSDLIDFICFTFSLPVSDRRR